VALGIGVMSLFVLGFNRWSGARSMPLASAACACPDPPIFMANTSHHSPAPQPLIEVKGLNHYYGPPPGGHLVLEDVDLTLYQNEVVGLLGRSGSGKSTLLRSIAGLIHPREGGGAHRQPGLPDPSVAMVFQTFALFPWLTVQQNVELGLERKGARRRAPQRAGRDRPDRPRRFRERLSQGIVGRDAPASGWRALVVNPSLLLMDEPSPRSTC
jgi:NitT/TauT family transport system ATP-binding protein